jgi:hypothetical protein
MVAAPRLFAVSVGVVALAWLVFVASRFGISGSASTNAAREMERMARSPGVSVSSGMWWREDLRQAVVQVPDDPTARELLAVSTAAATNDPNELTEVRDQLLKVIEERPGSGYTWANLASVKYRLGETDQVFEKSLVNAVKLAPHEAEVQRSVVDYGLAVLDEVQPPTRDAIERAVEVGMKRSAPEILTIAARRGRLGVACRHLDGVPRPAASKSTQLCQSMEATP